MSRNAMRVVTARVFCILIGPFTSALYVREMVIAQLTHLRIAIPSSGNPPGEVPSDCFPRMNEPGMTKTPKRVTFAPVFHTSTGKIDPLTTDQDAD